MKKKLLLITFMSLFVFLLVGCDFGGTTVTTTNSSQTTTTTVNNVTTSTTSSGQVTTTTTTGGTTTTTTVPFDRADLVGLIETMNDYEPGSEEAENDIDMLMQVFGYSSEAELYQMLTNVQLLMTGFMDVDSLSTFQTWYVGAKFLGFNEAMMTSTMMNALTMVLAQANSMSLGDIESEMVALELEIQDTYAAMASYQSDAAAVRDEIVTYASQFSSPVDAQVINMYDRLVIDYQAQNYYYDLYSAVYDIDDADYDLYNQLEDDLYNYLYYTYIETGSDDPQTYLAAYTSLLSTLSQDNYDLFMPILTAYQTYQEGQYSVTYAVIDSISSVMDSNLDYASSVVYYAFYDYQDLIWESDYLQWDIEDLNSQINDLNSQLMMIQVAEMFDEYLNTTEGLATTTAMMSMMYDTLDYIATNVSQSTFDFVLGLATGEMSMDMSAMSALEIVGLVTQVSDVLTLVSDSFSEADIANLTQFSQDIAAMYVSTLGMDPTEEAALITLINTEIVTYFERVGNILDELMSFMDAVSVAKVNAIMDFATLMNSGIATQNEQAVAIATVITVVLGDDSLDLSLLAGYAIDTIYDGNTMFDPDIVERDALKLSVSNAIDSVMTQAALLNGLDASNLTAGQLTDLQNFMTSVQDLMELVSSIMPQESAQVVIPN